MDNATVDCPGCPSNAADLCPECAQRREMLLQLGWYSLNRDYERVVEIRLRQIAIERELVEGGDVP